MLILNYDKPQNIHFIGIGGISMSGLASILLRKGFTVTGSDVNKSDTTRMLEEAGAVIHYGHRPGNIAPSTDLVIYTVAVKLDNPEMMAAREMGIPIFDRAALLGRLFSDFEKSIAVAGTHGKTTTTSMVAHILDASHCDPTVSVGGILPLIGGNIKTGQTEWFVSEACEYYDSFLKFFPKIAVILNVEADHLDYFEDLAHIRRSFRSFTENVPADGFVVINREVDDLGELVDGIEATVVTYGIEDDTADYTAKNIVFNDMGFAKFECYEKGECLGKVELQVPGIHNVGNALAALASGRCFGLPLHDMCNGLYHFKGTHRRFEYKGSLRGVRVVDDYAHHPTEIEATIKAVSNMTCKKLWVIFQPHTFTRTKALFNDFAKALSMADEVVLADIYSASRETDPGDIHSRDLMHAIREYGTPCTYLPSFDEIEIFILENCEPGDLVITMGAGDIYLVGEALV